MEEIREINGTKYSFYVTENEVLAREIASQEHKGYKIKHVTNGYESKFYKCVDSPFVREEKLIGTLYYNPDNGKFMLWKFIDPKTHIMKNSSELGINGAIFAKLRVGDYVYFKIGQQLYKIRIEKAVKVGNYKNFSATANNSELQFFIPISELTEIETKKKKSTRRKRKLA